MRASESESDVERHSDACKSEPECRSEGWSSGERSSRSSSQSDSPDGKPHLSHTYLTHTKVAKITQARQSRATYGEKKNTAPERTYSRTTSERLGAREREKLSLSLSLSLSLM